MDKESVIRIRALNPLLDRRLNIEVVPLPGLRRGQGDPLLASECPALHDPWPRPYGNRLAKIIEEYPGVARCLRGGGGESGSDWPDVESEVGADDLRRLADVGRRQPEVDETGSVLGRRRKRRFVWMTTADGY